MERNRGTKPGGGVTVPDVDPPVLSIDWVAGAGNDLGADDSRAGSGAGGAGGAGAACDPRRESNAIVSSPGPGAGASGLRRLPVDCSRARSASVGSVIRGRSRGTSATSGAGGGAGAGAATGAGRGVSIPNENDGGGGGGGAGGGGGSAGAKGKGIAWIVAPGSSGGLTGFSKSGISSPVGVRVGDGIFLRAASRSTESPVAKVNTSRAAVSS